MRAHHRYDSAPARYPVASPEPVHSALLTSLPVYCQSYRSIFCVFERKSKQASGTSPLSSAEQPATGAQNQKKMGAMNSAPPAAGAPGAARSGAHARTYMCVVRAHVPRPRVRVHRVRGPCERCAPPACVYVYRRI
eukprot:scaffold4424_cov113-Isochrysis_galbana.AAC.4